MCFVFEWETLERNNYAIYRINTSWFAPEKKYVLIATQSSKFYWYMIHILKFVCEKLLICFTGVELSGHEL